MPPNDFDPNWQPGDGLPGAPPPPSPIDLTDSLRNGARGITDRETRDIIHDATREEQERYIDLALDGARQHTFGEGSGFDVSSWFRGQTPGQQAEYRRYFAEYQAKGGQASFEDLMHAHVTGHAEQGHAEHMDAVANNQRYDPNSAIGQSIDAGRALNTAQNEFDSATRRATLNDVIEHGQQYADTIRSVNPALQGALDQAHGLGGRSDFYGGLQSAIDSVPQYADVQFRGSQAPQVGPAQGYGARGARGVAPAAHRGYDAALTRQVDGPIAHGYQAQDAQRLDPTQARGYRAERIRGAAPIRGADAIGARSFDISGQTSQATAQRVGRGELGEGLVDQALATPELGQVGRQLENRAGQFANSRGRLNADELRDLQQSIREGFASRGTGLGNGAVTAEALGRLTNERERMIEDLGIAQSINAGNQQERESNREFRQGVQAEDVNRQQFNAQTDLAAQQGNQEVGLRAALADQDYGWRTAISNQNVQQRTQEGNQAIAQRTQELNQAAQNQAGQFGAGQFNEARRLDTGVNANFSLADQAARNRASEFGANARNVASLTEYEGNLQRSLADAAARNDARRFGANAANEAGIVDTGVARDLSLADQTAQNDAARFGAHSQNQFTLSNQDYASRHGLFNQAQRQDLDLTNRDFRARQVQQDIANRATAGQLRQHQFNADRGYALNLAQTEASANSINPFALANYTSDGVNQGMSSAVNAYNNVQGLTGSNMFDPSIGVSLDALNAANLANYQNNIHGRQLGLWSGAQEKKANQSASEWEAGLKVGATVLPWLFCWVAREVYGADDPRWKTFRRWMVSRAPLSVFRWYLVHGERFAAFIAERPDIKAQVRDWMDERIAELQPDRSPC